MKQIKLTVLLTLLMSMVGAKALAYVALIDGIYYNFTETEAIVTYYSKSHNRLNLYSGDIVIPSKVTYNNIEYPVTTIGDYAFSNSASNITSVTIPSSIKTIGSYAFSDCSGLTTINIADGVTTIGEYAFKDCWELTSIVIPNSVVRFEKNAFDGCEKLHTVELPNTIAEISDGMFQGCRSLASISIPNSVTTIGEGAFYMSALKTITIPDNVKTIKSIAFAQSGLTSVTLSNGIEEIGPRAFDCYQLSDIYIPNASYIGTNAFSSVSHVRFGAGVSNIKPDAFDKSKLTTIVVDDDNPIYDSRDNSNAVIETETNKLVLGCSTTIIPYSVTAIGQLAFSHIPYMFMITIPDGVTSIEYGAFEYCISLRSIEIPNNVTQIGEYAFAYCTSLTTITIPNSVTNIGQYAFDRTPWLTNHEDGLVYAGKVAYTYKGTMPEVLSLNLDEGTLGIADWAFSNFENLTAISLPNTLEKIGEYAFYGCTNLMTIIALNPEPADILETTFDADTKQKGTLYVPTGAVKKYKAADIWKEFVNIMEYDPSSIDVQSQDERDTISAIYDLNGKRLEQLQSGLNIVRMNNGTTKTIVIK